MDAAGALTRFARSAAGAAIVFFALTIVMTWPLASALTQNIPVDYGDPLYAGWAIAWVSHQIGSALAGNFGALRHFWDANQLAPEPLSLALSDHFTAQALPVAPVYWITGNAVLTLALAYLMAFTVSGLGTYLLVRELTGLAVPAVVAGLVLAFNEFALYFEPSHLQVISTGWMPMTLYALRRYFTTRSRWTLAGAGVCLVLSNLSAGYYLLMFPPFVVLYCVWEIVARRAWRDRRLFVDLVGLGVAVALATAPFVWPYILVQRRYGFSRSAGEAAAMAAAVDSYIASMRRLAVGYLLATIALFAAFRSRLRDNASDRPFPLTGFFAVAALVAFWLSLGPAPSWHGQGHPGLSLYAALTPFWPGMNAIRVSARFASVFLVFFAVLTGVGAAALVRGHRRFGTAAVVVLAVLLLLANMRRPFPVNGELRSPYVNPPAHYLRPSPVAPAVYRYVNSLPPDIVLAEFPYEDLFYNTRYLYFSTFHWRRTMNGFTSFFPPDYSRRLQWMINPARTPEQTWAELRTGGVTHVIVHTGAWDDATARAILAVFESRGSRMHGRFDEAVVYELPRAEQEQRTKN